MFNDLPIHFERPGWLLLLLLVVPALLIAWRSFGVQSRAKIITTFLLRVLLIGILTFALTNPSWEKRGEGLTVSVVLDRSHSVPLELKDRAFDFLRAAAELREPDDRLACVITAKDAAITAMPRHDSDITLGVDEGDRAATDLAAGMRLAMAVMPDDTANRIVLASDGNETSDSVLAVAEIAKANNVPIDVLILEYAHRSEVMFERIQAPAQARLGQTIPVRLVLRSQAEASGTVILRLNDEPLDLSPDEEGPGRRVTLSAGTNVIPLTIRLDEPRPAIFEATFEPDSPNMDTITQNNTAMAVTFVGSEGRVLVLDENPVETAALIQALTESDIVVEQMNPALLTGGLVTLSGYDAVVLANVPRWSFDDAQDRMLHAYVHDLGGGLIMLGGPQSFGAGGWIESETSKALPVKLDPPQTRQMPRGALALVMHSCEMPQGNFWAQETARAAINALSRLDYVGIIEYDFQNRANMGAGWILPLQLAGDKAAAIDATKKLTMGDMKDFGPMLQLAFDGLSTLNAGQKHIIIISDGDPAAPPPSLMRKFVSAQITISAVMVIGHGSAMDRNKMQNIADTTGGRFYHVLNPTQLPEIFIKEATLVSRSLIQEGDYQPQVVSRLPGPVEGFSAVPGIRGYVLTAQREGLAQNPIVHVTEEGQDPIVAHWNYGLGKSIAFTSDAMGRWGNLWLGWPDFQAFWGQAIRWVMRPSSPANMTVNTNVDGDVATVEVEALEGDASFLNFLQTRGVVITPRGEAEPLPLQQVGPGRYRGQFRLEETGNHLINISYSSGAEHQGNLRAAVTVPYSREFRAVTHNGALLRQLAEMTGGRVLQAGLAPEDVDLFHRERLAIPKSAKAIWDLLVIIAASLLIIDVAARRLAIDGPAVAAYFRRLIGRREEVGSSTVAAWKKTRDQVAHRRSEREAGRGLQPADSKARFEATDEDAAHAIDVGSEQPIDTTPGAKQAPSRRDTQEKSKTEEGDYTSRLLAAKKRARRDENEKPKDAG